jgi:hypothetical protein
LAILLSVLWFIYSDYLISIFKFILYIFKFIDIYFFLCGNCCCILDIPVQPWRLYKRINLILQNTLWHLTASQLSISTTQSWTWIVREESTEEYHWWDSVHVCSFPLLLTRLPMVNNKEVASKLNLPMNTSINLIFNTCSHRQSLGFHIFWLWWYLVK